MLPGTRLLAIGTTGWHQAVRFARATELLTTGWPHVGMVLLQWERGATVEFADHAALAHHFHHVEASWQDFARHRVIGSGLTAVMNQVALGS